MNNIQRPSWEQKFGLSGILFVALAIICGFWNYPGKPTSLFSNRASLDACPTGPVTMSSGSLAIGDCTITGDVTLSGSATVSAVQGTLTLAGNLIVSDSAVFTVKNATLIFPQKHVQQYKVDLSGSSRLVLDSATVITNGTPSNNMTLSLNAKGSSELSASNSTLDNARSWMLGNFHNNSKLTSNDTKNIPSEIYPADSSQITLVNSAASAIWFGFQPSSSASLALPVVDDAGRFSMAFGRNSGTSVGYQANITNSRTGLGFNSVPHSTLILTGGGGKNPNVTIGYMIIDNPTPMIVSGLRVGFIANKTLNDLGRTLTLKNVQLAQFGWQIYCKGNSGGLITIEDSFVNELGGLQDSNVRIVNSTLQLADLAAISPTAHVLVDHTDIWSHSVQATAGGNITIENSTLHGNLFTAAGCNGGHCSTITLTNVTEANNGTQPTCSTAALSKDGATQGAPPPAPIFNPDGTPRCDPLNPLEAPSRYITADGGVINK